MCLTEAVIRMSMLNNVSSLLEKSSMMGYIEEELQRMQEAIMEIPIRMLRDVHDQVCMTIYVSVSVCVSVCVRVHVVCACPCNCVLYVSVCVCVHLCMRAYIHDASHPHI